MKLHSVMSTLLNGDGYRQILFLKLLSPPMPHVPVVPKKEHSLKICLKTGSTHIVAAQCFVFRSVVAL